MRDDAVKAPASRNVPLRAAALLTTVALVAAGCSEDGTPEEMSPADIAGQAAGGDGSGLEDAMQVDPGEPPVVELLDTGEDDADDGESGQRTLRYVPTPGEPIRTEVSYTDENRTRFADEPEQQTGTAPQSLVLAGRTEPGVDGAQTAIATVEELRSEDDDPARTDAFQSATGFELSWDRTGPGALTDVSFAAPAEASDIARAATEVVLTALIDMAVVFPEEPVGVGARWTVTREVVDGVAPTRVTTYTLTDLEGDRASVEVAGEAPVESEQISTETANGETIALDVTEYDVTIDGELTVDLRGAVPSEGSVNEVTTAEYSDSDTGAATAFDSSRTLTFTPAS